MTINLDQAELQYSLLRHDLGYTEIRIIGKNGVVVQNFVDNKKDFLKFIQDNEQENLYVGINPRKTQDGSGNGVDWVTAVVFDIDPIRPKGQPSSDQGLVDATDLGRKLGNEFKSATLVSSGSGAHVYIPIIPVRATPELAAKLASWARQLNKKYSTETLRLDSIFDFPRVIRVWGSWNHKSNRPCNVLDLSDKRLDLATFLPHIDHDVTTTLNPGNSVKPDYELRFEKLIKVNDNLSKLVKGELSFPSRSEADYLFIKTLLTAHFSADEIAYLSKYNVMGRTGKEFRKDDISRILDKINSGTRNSFSLSHASDDYFRGLSSRKPGVLTGFRTLDNMMAGLKPGRLYVIAARPTEGKTTFLTQIAFNLAKQNLKVLYFPTECGSNAIFDKIVSAETGINLRKFQFGSFDEADTRSITKSQSSVSSLPIIIGEDFALNTQKIEAKIKEIMPDILIVDFLQSMKFPEGGSAKELAQTVIEIKSFAGKYNIPVLLASQLNRSAEEGKASLTQLKGSGTIEEQGDEIMFLHTLDKLVYPRPTNLYVMKSKFGETGVIKLDFYASTCTFKERE